MSPVHFRGRIYFARGQLFARCGAAAFRALGRCCDDGPVSERDVECALNALDDLVAMLRAMRPRLTRGVFGRPVVLFTDGACEPGLRGLPAVGVGAVLFVAGMDPRVFGCDVPPRVVRRWAQAEDDQVIAQAELAPVLLAKLIWRDAFLDTAGIVFVDNSSALHSLVSGYSPTEESSNIIGAATLMDARLGFAQWLARVPSAANVADAPSRGMAARMAQNLGGIDDSDFVRADSSGIWDTLLELIGGEANGPR